MLDFDLRMLESGRHVLFTLRSGSVDRVRRLEVHQIVAGTRCSLERTFGAVLCTVSIDWSFPDVAGWYP